MSIKTLSQKTLDSKKLQRRDSFGFALGGMAVASPYLAIPVVSSTKIADAWDQRLAANESETDFTRRPGTEPCAA